LRSQVPVGLSLTRCKALLHAVAIHVHRSHRHRLPKFTEITAKVSNVVRTFGPSFLARISATPGILYQIIGNSSSATCNPSRISSRTALKNR